MAKVVFKPILWALGPEFSLEYYGFWNIKASKPINRGIMDTWIVLLCEK